MKTSMLLRALSAAALLACLPLAAQQTAPATKEDGEIILMDVFDVTSVRDVDYLSKNAESATRLNVPIADIPHTIVVFNQEFLKDIMAVNLEDVTLYDPTVNAFGNNDNLTIRGHGGGVTYFNGFEQSEGLGSQTLVNTERIEIIKGPNAVLYGTGAFGGIINRVSKKPLPRSFTRINASVDSHGYKRFTLDDNFPRVPKKLGLRLNASWGDGTIWNDRSWHEEVISLAASWQIARRTTLMAEFALQEQWGTPNWGFPVFGGNPRELVVNPGTVEQVTYPVDVRRFLGEKEIDHRKISRRVIYADFRHEFSRHFIFRSMFNKDFQHQDLRETFPTTSEIIQRFGRVMISRYYRDGQNEGDTLRLRNELVVLFNTWGWDHKMIIGQGWTRLTDDRVHYTSNTSTATYANSPSTTLFPAIDIVTGERIDPTTGALVGVPEIELRPDATRNTSRWTSMRSYYVNDLVTIIPNRFIVQAGIRYIESLSKMDDATTPANTYSKLSEDAITNSVGVVWHLVKNKAWTLYANRSQSFQPNFQLDYGEDGTAPTLLKAQVALQYEAGLKYVYRDKFNALFCWYDIMQNNTAVGRVQLTSNDDGTVTRRTRYDTIDGVHSQGMELSFNWRASRELTVFGGYAYTHCVNEDTGSRHYRVPLHAASFFARYAVRGGPLTGLSFNLGFTWRDTTIPEEVGGDIAQQPMWTVPPLQSIDVGVGYGFKPTKKIQLSFSARVTNLSNRINYLNTTNTYVSVTAPRTLTFAAALAF